MRISGKVRAAVYSVDIGNLQNAPMRAASITSERSLSRPLWLGGELEASDYFCGTAPINR